MTRGTTKQAADGSITGFDPDIARAICTEAKLQCELKAMDFDGIVPALQAKKFEVAIASMSITAERAKIVDFSDMYFNVPGRLLAKEGTQINDAWYKGKNIGVLRSAEQQFEVTVADHQAALQVADVVLRGQLEVLGQRNRRIRATRQGGQQASDRRHTDGFGNFHASLLVLKCDRGPM